MITHIIDSYQIPFIPIQNNIVSNIKALVLKLVSEMHNSMKYSN